jgi:Peptidase of plants and bacteria
MKRLNSLVVALAIVASALSAPMGAGGQTESRAGHAAVTATVETHLKSVGEHIRQLAFDGDEKTYFESVKKAGPGDHFTLIFDHPVNAQRIEATTGKPDGSDSLAGGVLETSHDGKAFHEAGRFRDGTAKAEPGSKPIAAIRIKPAAELKHALVIREVKITSEPPVAIFRYPVEIVIEVTDAPAMKQWAEKTARVCERAYPMINEELKSEGFTPARRISMVFEKSYDGVAATGNDRIVGSVDYFRRHPHDVGAMVHETVHVVQHYHGEHPGWLVEGIADYIRFFKFEPGKLGPIDADSAHYDGSYRVSAAFLAYVTEKYDKHLVRKLNAACRQGKYHEQLFKQLTSKNLHELDEEWRASLRRKP